MWGRGVGVRRGGLAFVVALGSTGPSSSGSTGRSVRVSASESINRFKNRLFSSSSLLFSSSLSIKNTNQWIDPKGLPYNLQCVSNTASANSRIDFLY
jgi:hypothetical protein